MNLATFNQNWGGEIEWDVLQCSGAAGLTSSHTLQFSGTLDANNNIIVDIQCTQAGSPPGCWATGCPYNDGTDQVTGTANGQAFTITRHPPARGLDKATLDCTLAAPVAPPMSFRDPGGSFLETFHRFLLAVVAFIVKLFIGGPPPSGAGPGSWVAEEGSNGNGLVYPLRAAS